VEDFMAGLARVVIRFRYVVIVGWLIAAALCVLLLPSLADSVNTDNSTFLPSSSPTQHALVLAAPFQPAGTTTGTLVVVGKAKLTSSDQSDIASLEAKIAKDDHVVSVSDQGVSTDGKAQKAQVVFNVTTSSPDASSTVAGVRATISGAHLPSGLRGYLTG
jgi:putative drug exporter of the RND superfamily